MYNFQKKIFQFNLKYFFYFSAQDSDEESEEEIVQDDVKVDEEDYDVTSRKLTKKQMKYDVIMGREREKKKKEECSFVCCFYNLKIQYDTI